MPKVSGSQSGSLQNPRDLWEIFFPSVCTWQGESTYWCLVGFPCARVRVCWEAHPGRWSEADSPPVTRSLTAAGGS